MKGAILYLLNALLAILAMVAFILLAGFFYNTVQDIIAKTQPHV